MAKKQKYYVVWDGIKTGIFDSWKECEAQVKNYTGARYKSFESLDEATHAFHSGPYSTHNKKLEAYKPKNLEAVLKDSIAVDAACEGNPGLMEYQGVNPHTGEKIFHMGPFEQGTNNIGEFLAIVHALALLQKNNHKKTAIYSDSITGISWVKNKRTKTNLVRSRNNERLFVLIERAISWLQSNTYSNPILKWETELWGENPADFGRK